MSHGSSLPPLRVLTLSTLYPNAHQPVLGTFVERQTLALAARADVDCHVVVPRGLPPWPLSALGAYRSSAALPRTEERQGLPIHRPRFTHWPRVGARFDVDAMVSALIPLLTQLRTHFAFDVIDAEYFFPDGLAAVKLGQHFNVLVSIKARGSDIHVWGERRDTRAQVLEAARAADGLLAVSAALKADMVALGMPAASIRVHYTGVDLGLFQLRERDAAKAHLEIQGPLIVSIGTLNRRKGHDLVIPALAHVPNATLVVVGTGPAQAALAALAVHYGVADRVRFTGSVGRAEIAGWLAAADVMALPSAAEGLANVWVEALASGTPVVTSDVGGAREVITSASAGRIVPRTASDVATAINDLLRNPPDRKAVRRHAERFTWDANSAALYAHLRGLVEARRRAS